MRPEKWFIGARGKPVLWCRVCRKRNGPGGAYARARPRRGLRPDAPLRVIWNVLSGNVKLGRIPTATPSASTCPPSCSLFGNGCYAESGHQRAHWASVPKRGLSWELFLEAVERLRPGALWRYAPAGDLPGFGERIDTERLFDLVVANAGRRGFGYTHKPVRDGREAAGIRLANELGLTINLSGDDPDHADRLAERGIAPVVCLLPRGIDRPNLRTPQGRMIVVCPAERLAGITCKSCRLCANASRKSIVGFPVHGLLAGQLSTSVGRRYSEGLVQLRLGKAS